MKRYKALIKESFKAVKRDRLSQSPHQSPFKYEAEKLAKKDKEMDKIKVDFIREINSREAQQKLTTDKRRKKYKK